MTTHHKGILPSLDLLRSCAIVLVVIAHTVLSFGAPPALAPLQLGGTGVDLFFVLSGWLLGRQIMLEIKRTGTVRLTRFWARRWMRTLPAYYAVLLATFLQEVLKGGPYELGWPYLVFGQNYLPHLTAFYVSWSLCVEEHFYLLVAPAVLLLAFMKGWRWPALVALLTIPLLCRVFGLYTTGNETHVRWDECSVGVVLAAIAVFRPYRWSVLCRHAPAMACGGLLLYAFNFWSRWHPQFGFADYDRAVYALIFGSFVILANASPWWQEHLYVPGASYLATRAYAVYLLHPDALALVRRAGVASFVPYAILGWIVTLACAEVLHRTIELPVMRAREQFAFSKSAMLSRAPTVPVLADMSPPTS